ncbi:MAG: ribbon-helix-helix protein, CopG family [Acidobacteriota bacterium]
MALTNNVKQSKTTGDLMTKRYAGFRIDEELLDGLELIRERDGVTVPEQVRRAIRGWLESKGVKVKAADRRVVKTRRKA